MSTLEKAVALSLQLKTANSAFQANPGGETARILREMAEALDIGVEGYFKLLDYRSQKLRGTSQRRCRMAQRVLNNR